VVELQGSREAEQTLERLHASDKQLVKLPAEHEVVDKSKDERALVDDVWGPDSEGEVVERNEIECREGPVDEVDVERISCEEDKAESWQGDSEEME